MMRMPPMASRLIMSTGSQRGLSFSYLCTFGVYRDEASVAWCSCSVSLDEWAFRRGAGAPAVGSPPGFVPLGVTRPLPVLRFGGATSSGS